MAEGGEAENLSSKPSMACGNEPVHDFYCILCEEDGKHIEAAGYCVDCEEYMCSACTNYHRKSRLSRHHEILDSDSMPRDTPISERVDKTITTTCPQHPKCAIEYFCKKHEEFGCATCFALGHRNCSDVVKIIDESANVLKGQDFQDFVNMLDSLGQRSRDIITKCQDNCSNMNTACSKTISSVKHFRKELDDELDRHENAIVSQVEALKIEKTKECQHVSRRCKSTLEAAETMSSSLKRILAKKKVCDLFILMKKDGEKFRQLKTELDGIDKQGFAHMCGFTKNTAVKEYLTKSNAFGRLFLHDKLEGAQNISTNVIATHVYDVNVKPSRDVHMCIITGSVIIDDERTVVVDYQNKKVKLLNMRSKTILSGFPLISSPHDITVIGKDLVAVTIEAVKKIFILKISSNNGLCLFDQLSTNGDCRGIASVGGKLVVTYVKPPKIEIMDYQGNIISANDVIFKCPNYVCVSHDGQEFYVSDSMNREVKGFQFDGRCLFTFRDISKPQNLCTDQDGNIYVCDSHAKCILIITAERRKKRVLLTENGGLNGTPHSVSICRKSNRLFVGMEANILKVYKLEKN